MSNRTFQNTGSLSPQRSQFDLSYIKMLTCDMGRLYPVMCDEVYPGDIFQISNQSITRFQPLVAPVLHEVKQNVHYFFVPYRLLWGSKSREELSETGDWQDFITGGEDGLNADSIPRWSPVDTSEESLWDYLGFPVDVDPDGTYPIDFPRRAYNFIFNEFYRDENLQTEVSWENEDILLRNWTKDYFTSSLLSQQKGVAPALPISGTTYADFSSSTSILNSIGGTVNPLLNAAVDGSIHINGANSLSNFLTALSDNEVDLSVASTFDIADLRLAFQIQRWMERNNRAGSRYVESLKAHFGVSPRDDRLQRPEYIGGSSSMVIFSEVLQTSQTDASGTPQGNLAGHGINVSNQFCGKIRVQEHGLIMGVMSYMPKPMYQQGINRQWLRETKYDFYFPEFSNLSEQGILNAEICAVDGDSTHNTGLFGYQGRYDELRIKHNMVCGKMRDTFDYWHLGRQFDPLSPPSLNEDFIQCDPTKRIFAVPSETGLVVQFANIINAFRPLPITAEPGLIDHN